MELPSDKLVVVWVLRGRDETTPPISVQAKTLQVLMANRREKFKPVVGVCKARDLCLFDTDLRQDLVLGQRRPFCVFRCSLLFFFCRLVAACCVIIDLALKANGSRGNRHTCAVECKWKQSTLANLSLKSCHKL